MGSITLKYFEDGIDVGDSTHYYPDSGGFSNAQPKLIKIQLLSIDISGLPVNWQYIRRFKKPDGIVGVVCLFDKTSVPGDFGQYQFESGDQIDYEFGTGADFCSSNSDCEQGFKCENGECVPCDKIVNGQGILTLYGVGLDGSAVADAHSREWVGSNSHEFFINGDPYAGVLVIPNGIQANLKISAYYGFAGAASWSKVCFDSPVNQQVIEFNYPPAQSPKLVKFVTSTSNFFE